MRLPVWLHNLLHRGEVPRLAENPYSLYDNSLCAKWFLWQLYHEVISLTADERTYLYSAVKHLQTHGKLVEDYVKLEDGTKIEESADDIMERMWKADGSSLYLYRDNLVSVKMGDDNTADLSFYYPMSKPCAVDDFKQWIVAKKGESRVSVLVNRNGLTLNKISFPAPVIGDLELNYGTGFNKVHQSIVSKLEARNGKLMILSGVAGSGKSTFIKYLSTIVDREFIFIPVGTAGRLSGEDMLPLLLNHKEAVLIIEDAEQVIQPRGTGGDDALISTILNISDGVLGTMLRTTVLLTLNSSDENIDAAILRKGRLSFRHTFRDLSISDAKRLAKSLGKDETLITKPTSLADVYGSEDDTGQQPEAPRAMGFSALLSSQANKKAD